MRYTIEEAAHLVQCHRNTLLNAIPAKKLTATKIGKLWRIRGE
jgi:excisionase family DNA binding protein